MGPVVSEEKSFEIVDGQTTEPAYTISSPGAFGSGELKRAFEGELKLAFDLYREVLTSLRFTFSMIQKVCHMILV